MPCSGALMSGMALWRKTPIAFTRRATSGRCSIVDPRDDHRVDLAEDAELDRPGEPGQLPIDQDARCLDAVQPARPPEDPGVDAGRDLGIEGVDGHGQVVDPGRASRST